MDIQVSKWSKQLISGADSPLFWIVYKIYTLIWARWKSPIISNNSTQQYSVLPLFWKLVIIYLAHFYSIFPLGNSEYQKWRSPILHFSFMTNLWGRLGCGRATGPRSTNRIQGASSTSCTLGLGPQHVSEVKHSYLWLLGLSQFLHMYCPVSIRTTIHMVKAFQPPLLHHYPSLKESQLGLLGKPKWSAGNSNFPK